MLNYLMFIVVLLISQTVFCLTPADSGKSFKNPSICLKGVFSRPLKGAKMIESSDGLHLEITNLQKSFLLPQESHVRRILLSEMASRPYLRAFPNEGSAELFVIGGWHAAIIYYHLLEYYKTHSVEACQITNYQGGIVFGEGVTCRWGRTFNFGEDFSCSFVTYSSRETSSAFISLPRPRMSSGNAKVLQDALYKEIFQRGWIDNLEELEPL